ncbi:hypothetical protein [Piscinibacter sp.]|uniref:hypothetical protein n=1 Tax=Piscinibacter sp. TaxID=1903157 RepID=UPI0039E37172
MQTLPSIDALAEYFGCQPRVEATHPELGALNYEVECDTEHERVTLSVLPVAEEVNVRVFTKTPSRFFLLGLEDVREIVVMSEEEEGEVDQKVEIRFHNTEVQTLSLRLRPVFMLIWGNQHDSPERHPPWER